MTDEQACAYVLARVNDLADYYASLDDPWAQSRSDAIGALGKEFQRTGIKALVGFQRHREPDLRSALRGSMALYSSPHPAEDFSSHARYIQTLLYEGQFITGLIGLA